MVTVRLRLTDKKEKAHARTIPARWLGTFQAPHDTVSGFVLSVMQMRATLALNQLQMDQYLDRRKLPARSPTAPLTPGNPRSKPTARKLPAYLIDVSQPSMPDPHPGPGSPVQCRSPVRRPGRSPPGPASPGPASPCANRLSSKGLRSRLNSLPTGDENRPLNFPTPGQTKQSAAHTGDMHVTATPLLEQATSSKANDSDLLFPDAPLRTEQAVVFADAHLRTDWPVPCEKSDTGATAPGQLLSVEEYAGLGALQGERGNAETAPEPLIMAESLSKEKAVLRESEHKLAHAQAAGCAVSHDEQRNTQSSAQRSLNTDPDCRAASSGCSPLEHCAENDRVGGGKEATSRGPPGPLVSSGSDGRSDSTLSADKGHETLPPPGSSWSDMTNERDSNDGEIVELRHSTSAFVSPLPSQPGRPCSPSARPSLQDVPVRPSRPFHTYMVCCKCLAYAP